MVVSSKKRIAHRAGETPPPLRKSSANSLPTTKRTSVKRAKPRSKSGGEYFHIEVRPSGEFEFFRTQDVGRKGGIQRVAGRRASGSWDDQKWLISKKHAHIRGRRLAPDTTAAKKVLQTLGSSPVRVRGDRFKAKPRPNVPEKAKPTPRRRAARSKNIKKAQKARLKK